MQARALVRKTYDAAGAIAALDGEMAAELPREAADETEA
jgi:hypothetical protein